MGILMKKIFITLISLYLICTSAFANTVDDSSIVHIKESNNSETYINGKIHTDVSDVQYVGNGYLVNKQNENEETERLFTEDFENFRSVSVFNDRENYDRYSRAGYMDEIIWADGVYMARSNVYDNTSKSGRCLEKEGYLYILDENFQCYKKIQFDWYVRAMSYVNGIYYVKISNRAYLYENVWGFTEADIVEKVYSSTDLENWTERDDLENIPLNNGTNVITLKDLNIYTFQNDQIGNKIVYENVIIENPSISTVSAQQILNKVGEYFYIVNNQKDSNDCNLWLSKDGVYMTGFNNIAIDWKNGPGAIVQSSDKGFIEKKDIDKYLTTGNIYVSLNDKILGFSQPPVMEDDRTLVPMRFLFEQMGANVNWNDATHTATATVPVSTEQQIRTFGMENEKSVTFSINNINATVNGQTATMDVPARLINDQTFVPLRFLSENLGYNVEWDEANNTVIITTK